MEVIIDGIVFSTKIALTKYIKNTVLPDLSSQQSFLLKLMERHPNYPDKFKPGISYFSVRRHFKDVQLLVHLSDGRVIDVSWKKCVSGKDSSILSQVSQAMRSSIVQSILTYSKSADKKCELCGNIVSLFEIDHAGIKFSEIRDKFLESNIITLDDLSCSDFMRSTTNPWNIKNLVLKNKWIEFHNQLATLRILCVFCHKKQV